MEQINESYAVWLDEKMSPEAMSKNETEAYLDVTARLRLKDGVHVMHGDGSYTFYKFPEGMNVDVFVSMWKMEDSKVSNNVYTETYMIDRIMQESKEPSKE